MGPALELTLLGPKIVVVSNEGRDLNAYRIRRFKLERVVNIDDGVMFFEVAQSLGIHGIHHQGPETTRSPLKDIGTETISVAGPSPIRIMTEHAAIGCRSSKQETPDR